MVRNSRHILFVDDNPGDLELACEALIESGKGTQLHTASDGVEALEFLRKRGKYEGAPSPDVVLLDLNMPRKDGIETLKEIRSDEALQFLNVVIFSSSTASLDRNMASLYHANAYVIKPLRLEDFMQTIARIEADWCTSEPTSARRA